MAAPIILSGLVTVLSRLFGRSVWTMGSIFTFVLTSFFFKAFIGAVLTIIMGLSFTNGIQLINEFLIVMLSEINEERGTMPILEVGGFFLQTIRFIDAIVLYINAYVSGMVWSWLIGFVRR